MTDKSLVHEDTVIWSSNDDEKNKLKMAWICKQIEKLVTEIPFL